MDFETRSLSPQESRVVLSLAEQRRREVTRQDIVRLLEISPKAADHIIHSLRRKGWLARASWGQYLLIPPEQGPDALGESNLLALASRITKRYYIGYGSAAAHYGLTTQLRSVIWLVTPLRLRAREIDGADVRIITVIRRKFFGAIETDVLGYKVMMSDIEKTVIDCVDRPEFAGGVGEATQILANGSPRMDWLKLSRYLDQIDSVPLIRRCGWLADHVEADVPSNVRTHLLERAAQARPSAIDRRKNDEGAPLDKKWHVFVNVTAAELQGTKGLGRRKSVRKDR